MTTQQPHTGLRAIALMKGGKACVVLAVVAILCAVHGHDVYRTANAIVRWTHLNPDWAWVHGLLDTANSITDDNIGVAIWWALAYALLLSAETYGLWRELQWAEWFTALRGGFYIPLEISSMVHRITWWNVSALLVSLTITGYVSAVLFQNWRQRRAEVAPRPL